MLEETRLNPSDLLIESWPPLPKKGMIFDSDNQRTGIRVIHLPTKLSVICMEHRQEYRNRDAALNKLATIVKHRNML